MTVMVAVAIYVAMRLSHSGFILPVVLASAAVFLTGLATFGEKGIDAFKKAVEIRQLLTERREYDRIVKLATPEEIKEYGQSIVERTLKGTYQTTGKCALRPQRFVVDSREDPL